LVVHLEVKISFRFTVLNDYTGPAAYCTSTFGTAFSCGENAGAADSLTYAVGSRRSVAYQPDHYLQGVPKQEL
jgi:hypothetical protein